MKKIKKKTNNNMKKLKKKLKKNVQSAINSCMNHANFPVTTVNIFSVKNAYGACLKKEAKIVI